MLLGKKGKQTEKHPAHICTDNFYAHYAESFFKYKEKESSVYFKINKKSKYFLSKKEFANILDVINTSIKDKIINENFEWQMPIELGTLSIRKYKPKNTIDKETNKVIIRLPINWNATLKLWNENPLAKEKKALIRHTNDHTKGFTLKWHWQKKEYRIINKRFYKFNACRTADIELNDAVKKNNNLDFYLAK